MERIRNDTPGDVSHATVSSSPLLSVTGRCAPAIFPKQLVVTDKLTVLPTYALARVMLSETLSYRRRASSTNGTQRTVCTNVCV